MATGGVILSLTETLVPVVAETLIFDNYRADCELVQPRCINMSVYIALDNL